jgi:hypothetical protein
MMTTDKSLLRSPTTWITVVVVLVFVVYPLSVGPAMWAVMHTESETMPGVYDFLYRPLFSLAEHDATLHTWLSWYVDVCGSA